MSSLKNQVLPWSALAVHMAGLPLRPSDHWSPLCPDAGQAGCTSELMAPGAGLSPYTAPLHAAGISLRHAAYTGSPVPAWSLCWHQALCQFLPPLPCLTSPPLCWYLLERPPQHTACAQVLVSEPVIYPGESALLILLFLVAF